MSFFSFCSKGNEGSETSIRDRNKAGYTQINDELNDEKQKATKLGEENADLKTQIEQLKQQLNAYEPSNDDIDDNSAELQSQIDTLQQQLVLSEEKYESSQEKVRELTEKLNNFAQISQNEAEELRKKHEMDIDSYKEQIQQSINKNEQYQSKIKQIESQRIQLLSKMNDDTNDQSVLISEQLETYQQQNNEKDNEIEDLQEQIRNLQNVQKRQTKELESKIQELTENNRILKEESETQMDRADGMESLLTQKSIENMQLTEQLNSMKEQIESLQSKSLLQKSQLSLDEYRQELRLKPFEMEITFMTYYLQKANTQDRMTQLWSEIDVDGFGEIELKSNLNKILKSLLDYVGVEWVERNVSFPNQYKMSEKLNVEITNEEILLNKLKTDFLRGYTNREWIKNKQMLTKTIFLDHFIECIANPNYDITSDNTSMFEDDPSVFDQLQYIASSPTLIGAKTFEFDTKMFVNNIARELDNDEVDGNDDDSNRKLKAAIDILVQVNSEQRAEIGKRSDILSKIEVHCGSDSNSLNLLKLVMKPLRDCDAKWLHEAMESNDNDTLIEILFTRTNTQLKALAESYSRMYDSALDKAIDNSIAKNDEIFGNMCLSLIDLKRKEEAMDAVNKDMVGDDTRRLQNSLDVLYELVAVRSSNHLFHICQSYEKATKLSILDQIKEELQKNENNLAMKASYTVLSVASHIHEYFAELLFKSSNDNERLQRIVLSRSEFDFGDILKEFTNNSQYGVSSISQWLKERTGNGLYTYILLSLAGDSDIRLDDNAYSNGYNDDMKENTDANEYNDGYNEKRKSEPKEQLVEPDPSIRKWPNFNAKKDANTLKNWLQNNNGKIDKSALKKKLANLLPLRTAMQRGQIVTEYPYVMDDIRDKLKKGHVVTLCDGMFTKSIAEYDALCVFNAKKEGDLEAVANVICTKNNAQILQIKKEYKKLSDGADLLKHIAGLCENMKKLSVGNIFNGLIRCKRDENTFIIDEQAVKKDVLFLIGQKKFKDDDKRRFVQIFTHNNWKYIRAIRDAYVSESKSLNNNVKLETLITKSMGSGSGYSLNILLNYSCDPSDFFVKQLQKLGNNKFDKNRDEIARILLSRSEYDLNGIRKAFLKNANVTLEKWILNKSKNSNFGFFLAQIVTAIDRLDKRNSINASMKKSNQIEIGDQGNSQSDQDTDADAQELVNTKSLTKKKNYADLETQNGILNSDESRQKSLKLFMENDNGLVKFLKKYLKSQIIEKMWNKLDSENKGYVTIVDFPDLLAFTVVLYKVKVHQQKTKKKTKPKVNNKQTRAEVEHVAMWMARTYSENDVSTDFKLTIQEFQHDLAQWAQSYVDSNGIL